MRSSRRFLDPEASPEVIYTDDALDIGKACEHLGWNPCASTPRRSETHSIAAREVWRVEEGICAILLQSGLGDHRGQILWSVTAICAMLKTSCQWASFSFRIED